VRIAAVSVNCNKWDSDFCEKHGVKETPAVVIYPSGSAPPLLYQGKMEAKELANQIAKLIPDTTTQLRSKAAVDRFLGTDRALQKLLLFSNKKTPPTMWKSLSSDEAFKHTMKFGFVSEADTQIVQRFKVKQFPTILALGEEQVKFKGEPTFAAIKLWLTLLA